VSGRKPGPPNRRRLSPAAKPQQLLSPCPGLLDTLVTGTDPVPNDSPQPTRQHRPESVFSTRTGLKKVLVLRSLAVCPARDLANQAVCRAAGFGQAAQFLQRVPTKFTLAKRREEPLASLYFSEFLPLMLQAALAYMWTPSDALPPEPFQGALSNAGCQIHLHHNSSSSAACRKNS